MTGGTWRSHLIAVLAVTTILALRITTPEAHKPITSK